MKRAIEWVDEVFPGGRTQPVLPSVVLALVQSVREEVLDQIELELRRRAQTGKEYRDGAEAALKWFEYKDGAEATLKWFLTFRGGVK